MVYFGGTPPIVIDTFYGTPISRQRGGHSSTDQGFQLWYAAWNLRN